MNRLFNLILATLVAGLITSFFSCSKELVSLETPNEEIDPEFWRIKGAKQMFDDEYSQRELRNLSPNAMFDYKDLKPLWAFAKQDTLRGEVITTAVPIEMSDFNLPISSTLDKEDVASFEGSVSFPRLYHFYRPSDKKEELYVVILLPTKDWLQKNKDFNPLSTTTVPKGFVGEVELYSIDKKLIKGYVFRNGICISAYIPQEGEQLRMISCRWVISGYTYMYINGYRGSTPTRTAIPQWELNCTNDMTKISEISDEGGGGGQGVEPPLKTLIDKDFLDNLLNNLEPLTELDMTQKLEKMCEEIKMLVMNNITGLGQKIADLRKYRDETNATKLSEKGWAELSDGTFKELVPKNTHSMTLDGVISDNDLQNGISIKGMLHNHNKPVEDKVNFISKPIQIYSPEDFEQFFLALSKSQRKNSRVLPKEVYSVLVAEGYTYILRYNLDREYLQNSLEKMGGPRREELKKNYPKKWAYLSPEKLLQHFHNYLRNTYPLDGLSVHRIDKNNNVKSILMYQPSRPTKAELKPDFSKLPVIQINKDC